MQKTDIVRSWMTSKATTVNDANLFDFANSLRLLNTILVNGDGLKRWKPLSSLREKTGLSEHEIERAFIYLKLGGVATYEKVEIAGGVVYEYAIKELED